MPDQKRMCPKCGSKNIHFTGANWSCVICGLRGQPTKATCLACGTEVVSFREAKVCLGGCPENKEKIAAAMQDTEPAGTGGKKGDKKEETEE